MSEDIDKKFDNAEKIVDRFGKLALKVVGTLVGIVIAGFAGYNQFKGDDKETLPVKSEVAIEKPAEGKTAIPVKSDKQKIADGELYIIDKTFDTDVKGDTFYIDYWSDGVKDEYYPKKK